MPIFIQQAIRLCYVMYTEMIERYDSAVGGAGCRLPSIGEHDYPTARSGNQKP